MATATQGTKAVVKRFHEDGVGTFHQDEIVVGSQLLTAAVLLHGKSKVRRLLKSSPEKVFQPLRYGRRIIFMPDESGAGYSNVMIDRPPFFGGKAGSQHIMVPDRKGWVEFARRVQAVAQLPRWADGLSAAAEVLDDLGYAIAESIAAIQAFDMETDEGIIFSLRR